MSVEAILTGQLDHGGPASFANSNLAQLAWRCPKLVFSAIPPSLREHQRGFDTAFLFTNQCYQRIASSTLIAVVALCLWFPSSIAAEQTPALRGTAEIDDVSQSIVLKELELNRLIEETELRNLITTPWKRRRQYLWALTNATLTISGLITADYLFYSHSHHKNRLVRVDTGRGVTYKEKGFPNPIGPSENKAQLEPQVLGQIIGGSGNLFEFTFNWYNRFRMYRDRVSPGASLKRARALLDEIDGALARRAALSPPEEQYRSEYEGEGVILNAVRDYLVHYYAHVYVSSREQFAWQQTAEFIDVTRNAIGATGNQMSIAAGYARSNQMNGTGNLLSFISATGITTRPYIASAVASMVERRARHTVIGRLRLEPGKEADSPDTLDAKKRTVVERLAAGAQLQNARVAARRELLTSQSKLFEREVELVQRLSHEGKIGVKLDTIRSTVYGPEKMFGTSLMGMIRGYGNYEATHGNHLSAAGNTAYTAGQGFNISFLNAQRAVDERDIHRDKKAGRLPSQVMKANLAKLDAMIENLNH